MVMTTKGGQPPAAGQLFLILDKLRRRSNRRGGWLGEVRAMTPPDGRGNLSAG